MTEDIAMAPSERDNDTAKHKLTTRDYNVTTLRSYFLQNGFNYSNYQGLGYGLVLYPAFKKIYGEDTDRLVKELEQNSEFYNTNPNFLPFVTSLHLAMADEGADYEDIRGIKMALMGPLAGIGDSLSQFCIAPLFSTIFSSLAMSGVAAAPLLFLAAMNGVLISIKFAVAAQGRKVGTAIIDKLSSELSTISETASMIGVTAISGLVATYVKMNVGISFAAGVAEEGVKQSTVNIQSMLDGIAPALLPVLYTALMYWLIKKKGWNTYKLVILTVVLGIVLSVCGVLV
ncbi:MAG: PTS system mannose/fructose/sorbose family transporter subunit IID [Coriobacteriaceae bacterium]|nr:PTS system mannose/fructose/sorbose family transporter subunit IID [Coriobacteriaceae bacterium]MCI6845185.1 PTS system mannose/fructose/sorbose family transporter subunit IID [Coriobacteriaceae bacterium]MCI7438186.1 PTS system mannose/fructose/sorbose family transporter subunit IID [Coriobacteriaceae bacterium]